MNNRKTGTIREEAAARWLEKQGVKIMEQNFRCRAGEIDLVVKDQDYLVFVEVKYRKSSSSGYPIEAVTKNKQKSICKVADFYRLTKKIPDDQPLRYDIIGILGEEIIWYQNAFDHVRWGF